MLVRGSAGLCRAGHRDVKDSVAISHKPGAALTLQSSNCELNTEILTTPCIQVFTAAVFIIPEIWKQSGNRESNSSKFRKRSTSQCSEDASSVASFLTAKIRKQPGIRHWVDGQEVVVCT